MRQLLWLVKKTAHLHTHTRLCPPITRKQGLESCTHSQPVKWSSEQSSIPSPGAPERGSNWMGEGGREQSSRERNRGSKHNRRANNNSVIFVVCVRLFSWMCVNWATRRLFLTRMECDVPANLACLTFSHYVTRDKVDWLTASIFYLLAADKTINSC